MDYNLYEIDRLLDKKLEQYEVRKKVKKKLEKADRDIIRGAIVLGIIIGMTVSIIGFAIITRPKLKNVPPVENVAHECCKCHGTNNTRMIQDNATSKTNEKR